MSALSSDRFHVSIWFSGLGIPPNFNTLNMSYLINVQQSILTSLHENIETKASVSTASKKRQLAIAWRLCSPKTQLMYYIQSPKVPPTGSKVLQ